MGFPFGALIGTGLQLWGGRAQQKATDRQNLASQQFARDMYQLQRKDALEFWNMQNEYNSPAAQAARLEDAGLNKALLYGGSPSGVSGQAGSIKTPDVQQAQFRVPDLSGIRQAGKTFMDGIYDLRIKQAEAKKTEAEATETETRSLLNRARLIGESWKNEKTRRKSFDWDSIHRLEREKLAAEVDIMLSQEGRDTEKHRRDLTLMFERSLSERASRAKTRAEKKRIEEVLSNSEINKEIRELQRDLLASKLYMSDAIFGQLVEELVNRAMNLAGYKID